MKKKKKKGKKSLEAYDTTRDKNGGEGGKKDHLFRQCNARKEKG